MKKLVLLLIGLSLTLYLAGQSTKSPSASLGEIDDFILGKMELLHIPGLSACIIVGDSIVWHNNYGYMNLEDSIAVNDSTLFNVFSVGKTVTAATIMSLWDHQLLGLDQDINDFIPFHPDNPYVENDSISARMLMAHTASINDGNVIDYTSLGDPTEPLGSFLENFLTPDGVYYSDNNYFQETPGITFQYSNYGAALNGYLVEPLTGRKFNEYARDSIFNKLNMPSSAWFLSELNLDNHAIPYEYLNDGSYSSYKFYGHPAYPGLSLHSTALELGNFAMMLLNNGVFKGEVVLSSQAIDSMKTVQVSAPGYEESCLGLFKLNNFGGRTVWGHNGGGVLGSITHLYFCPEENSAIVITINLAQWVYYIVEYMFDYASLISGISEDREHIQTSINMYPNPTKGKLNFELSDNSIISGIEIYNIQGSLLKNQLTESSLHTINVSDLPSGIYILKIRLEEGFVIKKLVKQ